MSREQWAGNVEKLDSLRLSAIISGVKKGGNRRRRIHKKHWLLRKARRDFLNPRVSVWKGYWATRDQYTQNSVSAVAPNKPYEITLPSHLDFEQNYEQTVTFLRLIRDASRGKIRIKKLRFHDLEFISPAAALVLASEVDRWNQWIGGKLTADVATWNSEIKRLLHGMGYFELLKITPPSMSELGESSSVTFLKFMRGESGTVDGGKLVQQLRINIEQIVGQGIEKHSLFEGLSEAITNVGQHAYPSTSSEDQGKKQWWLSASFDSRSRELCVMFYDQGVGIPATLPNSRFFEWMKATFWSLSDSEKIEAAMEYGRSSVPGPERGKGLNNLRAFAEAYNEGRLSIYSQRGLFRTAHTRADKVDIIRRDHQKTVGGTLIEWSVKL